MRDWKSVQLKDAGTWLSGGTPFTDNPRYWDGDIPWISAASLKDFHISRSDRCVTELGAVSGTRLVPPGTVLFVVRGMSLKTEFRVGVTERQVAFGQDCKAIIPVSGVDAKFLALALKARSREILAMVDEAGHGTGRLPTDLIAKLRIDVPALPEQRRITEILDSADEQIKVSLRLLAKQEATLKSLEFAAVRDSMSSPPITIGEIIRNAPGGLIQTGPFGSQLHAYEYVESGVPVVMPQDMIGQSITEEKIVRIGESKAQALSRHRMIPGDVVFGRRGDLSRCAVVAPEQEGWLCGTGCLLVRLPSGPVRPEWLALTYRHDVGQRQVLARAVGSTMVNLNTKIISAITIPVPDIEEQERKIYALAVHRRAINCLSLEINKQNIIKQGLMDDLLTGRVRVAALYLGVEFVVGAMSSGGVETSWKWSSNSSGVPKVSPQAHTHSGFIVLFLLAGSTASAVRATPS